MKTLTLITKENVNFDNVKETIKKTFPTKQIVDEKADYLFIGKYPTEIIVELFKDDFLDDPEYHFSEEAINLIPFEKKYCSDISYHSFTIIKSVVEALLPSYPEMWVYDDDYSWIGPAQDFINSNHQDKSSNYIGPNRPELDK